MYISVTIQIKDKIFNLNVDNFQVINNCFKLLKASNKYGGDIPNFYRSKLLCETVSGYKTFESAGISNGDILVNSRNIEGIV